jgi:catechol 2,3-dioxygenase-like lactoylglutathione lyase family enzyme
MKINHITVLVKDNYKALDFYADKLGFEKIIVDKHCWAKVGEIHIHLAVGSGSPTKDSFQHFCVAVDNLPEYINNLKKKDVQVEKTEYQFFVKDLDGNLIEFIDMNNKYFTSEK